MDKKTLRTWAKEKRKEINLVQTNSILTNKLLLTEEFKQAENIMLYYPLPNEVNLLNITDNSEKHFYLPRINGQNLECCRYISGDKLKESSFHTKEPVCKACSKTDLDIVIVPALACDKNNYRLGYGGGFYDRFLSDFNGIKICCIPNELYIEDVFPQKHDIKMDLIITD